MRRAWWLDLAITIALLIMLFTWHCQAETATSATELVDRHWDGINPFEAPSRTTDCYGSGDINLDGTLSDEDVRLLRIIVGDTRKANVRADVDGNGAVDSADLPLLEAAVQGQTLPGWWNRLETAEERVQWMRQVMAIDFKQLIDNKEAGRDWACGNYAMRSFLKFAPQILDPSNPMYARYGIAQHTYNLPLYVATATTENFGHALNAILIGDDPTVFTNWFFYEPQEGARAYAGDWNLPWGAQVCIQLPNSLNAPYHRAASLVEFQLTQPDPLTLKVHPNLVKSRPTLTLKAAALHNSPNVWQPQVLPDGDGMLLFNKSRDDLLRATDLHLLTNVDGDPNTARPLAETSGFSRLLNATPGGSGEYHLLWVGHTDWQEALFYGKLILSSGMICERKLIATNIVQGQVLGIGADEAYVFYPTDEGLVCVHKEGEQWGPLETVLLWTVPPFKIGSPCFTVTTTTNQEPWVIWADETSGDDYFETTLFETQRHNAWQASRTIDVVHGFIPNLTAARQGAGTIHIVYANTWFPALECTTEGSTGELWHVVRGDIVYRAHAQAGWTKPQTVASNSFWPALTVTRKGAVLIGWETDLAGGVTPVWTDFTCGTPPQPCPVNGTPYFPAITETTSGAILMTWSEASQRGYSTSKQVIREPEKITTKITPEPTGIQITWQASSAGVFQVESRDGLSQNSWQPVGKPITTTTNYGSAVLPVEPTLSIRLYRVRKL